ncbi:MAG: aspartate racemase [Candidatus Komeilibacteria bacterium CG11_big_fil_rev_8_21_14_0_20_36_20]|uniref:Aspartate racemase n=1 Tax=Candidatus Komeilibacteria bacterium CG11_big_fil_rev_8_21_14_0_20_36_20 TaxID=1974477 RepID=A0A2H0NCB1_9BACT|nr:MAG: aspartate racemase [Candidatus Komeilibacteria bacterium CG11_big_fil_rev_8_21_14_0_20_36_20]PIR81780.1 MAG: aspartate racemase [Candidatus Komeilibacteria bacterium CG10_big_fil_rev_8_21_14_0_10_36_65]PJC55799.1 MAG: aspartate racemase [Candidatus Komeilibacteria bacterium CG_4_9_14_0_2_um_filter_36_13]
MKNKDFILGILGGLGPMAGVELQKRIIMASPAKTDQEHIKMVCFTNPKIKDRTHALQKGNDFSQEVIRSLTLMSLIRVSVGIMVCNTAHADFDKIKKGVKYPLINLVLETVEYLRLKYSYYSKVGLLATDGTLQSGIYHQALAKYGFKVVAPTINGQQILMQTIYGPVGIKAGYFQNNKRIVNNLIKKLQDNGAQIIILGCTELSLVGIKGNSVLDPLDVMAKKIVGLAY